MTISKTSKKLISLCLFLCSFQIIASVVEGGSFAIDLKETYNTKNMVKDYGSVKFDDSVTSRDVIKEIGFGWNLGNTLDAWDDKNRKLDDGLTSETSWGNPATTKEMIQALVKKGFTAIRIPVTWHNHLIDDKYTIDPKWMARVKTIVDWCLGEKMYVILNTHHDNHEYSTKPLEYGQGYFPLNKDKTESEKFIFNVWKQIANAFNSGYDHHLIFEGLNEPRMLGMKYEWSYDGNDAECQESEAVLNEYHRLIHKAIRETGGNNKKRFILVTPLSAGYAFSIYSRFELPDDSKYNPNSQKLIVSVHMYAPYEFAMLDDMTIATFTSEVRETLYQQFKELYLKYVKKGINVIVGEMGTVNKNNTLDRIKWGQYYIGMARKFQFGVFIWDNGYYDNSLTCNDIFGHFHRQELTWENSNIINAYLTAGKAPLEVHNYEVFVVEPIDTFDASNALIDYGTRKFDESITTKDLINEMQFGWNLGNTFDAWEDFQNQGLESETCWGNPKTTEQMISEIINIGFKAIRIPVTWHNHLIDNKYTIDPKWMERVKNVVDWCLDKGLYVILNIHHDNYDKKLEALSYGQGYYPLKIHQVESEKFIYNVWRQIVLAFNNGYDHHLIFEGLNEPRMRGMAHEWSYDGNDADCQEAEAVLNEYERLFHKAVRESGGNNAKRFILITPLSAGFDFAINSRFTLPDDSKYNPTKNKMMVSVHMYAPYEFAMLDDMTISSFNSTIKTQLNNNIKALYEKFMKRGIHVVIGEMGTVNKNNTKDRIEWGEYYISRSRQYQFTAFTWDNGYYDNSLTCNDIFGHFIRDKLKWENAELIKAYLAESRKSLWNSPDSGSYIKNNFLKMFGLLFLILLF